ncbi:HWE histidine kinase domain-containing protein [Coralloluteibacterium thermophilus]|uniref:histidine kinase n=1 Tax=Coralloluteibacterium thermophilum TaxID=2707049 RepID=A0ABV9NJZ2_9GAMM
MADDSNAARLEAELRECATAPIHLSGAIQPHGWLLAVSMPGWTIRHASANAGELFGVALDALIGSSLDAWLSREVLHALGNAVTAGGGEYAGQQRAAQANFGPHALLCDVSVHRAGPHLHVEIEPAEHGHLRAQSPLVLAQAMIGRLAGTRSMAEFHARAAQQMRALIGFDRVMIYRFLHDGTGKVIAESRRAGLDSYLDLHYPASDIPPQARELYRRNRIRLIPDARYAPVPVLPARDGDGQPLDLGLTALRSVAPVHLEYLRNMGVACSMSVSVLCEGALWGLIACHHATPRRLPIDVRAAADLFGMFYSMQVASRERAEDFDYASRARIVHDEIVAGLGVAEDPFAVLAGRLVALRRLVPCDGAGLFLGGTWRGDGATPPPAAIPAIVRALAARGEAVPCTHALGGLLEEASAYARDASGALGVPLGTDGDWLLLFRREVVETVSWAGDPNRPYRTDSMGRLSPRASFAAWTQAARGTSAPWSAAERRVAGRLGDSLAELRMRRPGEAAAAGAGSQALVIAELNHRVKNMLALMQSMVMHSAETATDVKDFVETLEGRIRALAFAHDQYDARTQIGTLRDLVEAELAPYHGREGRFALTGPQVLLDARARSALALVLHEMATNAAKAGSLSRPEGRVEVRWEIDATGDCRIAWAERDGPPVTPPAQQGFGSTLIRRAIPHELGGRAEVRYLPAGVEALFVVPAAHLRTVPPPGASVPGPAPAGSPVEGLAALVLEDNMLIAMDTEHALRRLGAAQVEIAATVEDALRILDAGGIGVAVIDVHLGGGRDALPVAARLAGDAIPFAFATGDHDRASIPAAYRDVPVIPKPGTAERLREVLDALLDGRPVPG